MAELPTIPSRPTPRRVRGTGTLTHREPTGRSPWPTILLAGGPKAETAILAAEASGSELIAETLWVPFQAPSVDALGSLPGARFVIAEHDGSLEGFEDVLADAANTAAGDQARKPLQVVDGISQAWHSTIAAQRATNPNAPVDWDAVDKRWGDTLADIRRYPGPSILIARTVEGALQGPRTLAHEVDVLVELDDDGTATVHAPRTSPPIRGDILPRFRVEEIWLHLNIEGVSRG